MRVKLSSEELGDEPVEPSREGQSSTRDNACSCNRTELCSGELNPLNLFLAVTVSRNVPKDCLAVGAAKAQGRRSSSGSCD